VAFLVHLHYANMLRYNHVRTYKHGISDLI